MKKGGLTMRKREIMRSRTLAFTAVLGVAAVLLLASTAVAQGPGGYTAHVTNTVADGQSCINITFRVWSQTNDTQIYVVVSDPGYYDANDVAQKMGFNVSCSDGTVWFYLSGSGSGNAFILNHTNYTTNPEINICINSTAPVPEFTLYLVDAGNSDNKTTILGLDFDASQLSFTPDQTTITAGQISSDIQVKATGADPDYADREYSETVEFRLNKSADVWLVKDSTTYTLPAQLSMENGFLTIKVNGTQAGVYNLTVNVTGAPWLQNDTMQITINPAAARYITATVDRDSMVAGATTNYTNCTFYILDVFNNINTTAVADVNIAVSSPAAGTNVTNATAPGNLGQNITTWVGAQGNGTFRIRIANATMPDAWVTQPCFNITVNATVGEGTWLTPKKPEDAGLPVPSGISTEVNLTTNSTILRTLEVEPADANKIVILKQCNGFQANGNISETYNITAAIKDQWDNYCIKTTNATGAQIIVTFNITDNRTCAYLSADMTPDGDTPGPVDVSVTNTTGIAIAKIYLWSDKPLLQNCTLTVNLTNLQGLLNTSTTVNVTPWFVDHVDIIFVDTNNATKSELIANGADVAYIIAYLVDADGNIVTTADGTDFTTAFKLVYDANNKSEGWICNASACASRIGTLESDIVTAVPTNGVIYGNVTGLYINATATNATACSDNPIQSMNVEANASTPYGYKTGAANISVGPDEPAQVDLQTTVTSGVEVDGTLEPYAGASQTDYSGLSLEVVVTDAYDNIVRDGTQVWFGATGGVIKTNNSIIDGKVVALTQNGCVSPYAYYKPIFNYTDSEAQYVTASITAYSENSTGTVISDTETLRFWAPNPVDPDCWSLPTFCDVTVEEIETGKWQINVYFKADEGNLVQPYWNSTAYFYTTAGTITPSSAAFDNGKCSATLELDPGETAEVVVNVGNWGIHTETLSRPYEFDDTLHLKAGWNFVSVPKRLDESCNQFNELFNTSLYPNISSILYYDPTTGWDDKIGTSDHVNVLDGYWVYTTEAYDIPLTYKSGMFVPPTKELIGGAWNAIGFSATEPYSAEATLKSVDAYWVTAIGWDATAQAFEDPIINGVNSPSVEMYPGEGYWLFVTNDCTLAALSA